MKGVSAVIATILVLMITLGIAGVAASYMFGWIGSRTTVVLAITDAECTSNGVDVWVRNDGTQDTTGVTVDIVGTAASCQPNGGSIEAGKTESCTAGSSSPGIGYHTVRATTTGARASGSVYCPT